MTVTAVGLLVLAAIILVAVVAYGRVVGARVRRDAAYVQRQLALSESVLATVRELVLAARESAAAVRERLDAALRAWVPAMQSLAIFDVDGEQLTCVYASGRRVADYVGTSLERTAAALPAVAYRAGKPRSLVDAPGAKALHPSDRDAVAIPFTLDPGVGSVVYVSSDPPPADGWDPVARAIAHFAPSYWVATERDAMVQQLTHDPLTGALNRFAFDLRLREALERGADVSVLFLDLDGFKAWNDTYGHQSGDHVLRQATAIMRDHVFSLHDLVGRRGGDEFCIAFVGVPKSRAIERAIALGAEVYHADRTSLVVGAAPPLAITACIGVASLDDAAFVVGESGAVSAAARGRGGGVDVAGLIAKADALMYYSKRNGKDRVAYLLEDGQLRAVCSSEVDRRDYQSRPPSDRRGAVRPFIAPVRQFTTASDEAHGGTR